MTLKEQIATWFAYFIIAVLCLFLAVIVRFGILSRLRARGWRKRLRHPKMAEVESEWGVRLPRALEPFFESKIVDRFEFYLAPPNSDRESEWWYVAGFIPLTPQDIAAWIATTKVPGIPIADDGSKGVYYLPFDQLRQGKPPAVLLRPPGWQPKDIVVASSVEQFIRFEPRAVPKID